MTETAERIEDRLSDFTRDKRILLLSAMAVVVGLASAFVAKALAIAAKRLKRHIGKSRFNPYVPFVAETKFFISRERWQNTAACVADSRLKLRAG